MTACENASIEKIISNYISDLKLGIERLHDVQLHGRFDPQVLHIGHLVEQDGVLVFFLTHLRFFKIRNTGAEYVAILDRLQLTQISRTPTSLTDPVRGLVIEFSMQPATMDRRTMSGSWSSRVSSYLKSWTTEPMVARGKSLLSSSLILAPFDNLWRRRTFHPPAR